MPSMSRLKGPISVDRVRAMSSHSHAALGVCRENALSFFSVLPQCPLCLCGGSFSASKFTTEAQRSRGRTGSSLFSDKLLQPGCDRAALKPITVSNDLD